MKRIGVIIILLRSFLQPAVAELVWETESFSRHATVVDTCADFDFRFKNNGTQPVTITEIKSSCDCTVANPDKKIVNPGETGAVHARFNFGARTGLQKKTIAVATSDGERARELKLSILIPEAVRIHPTVLWWRLDEEAATHEMKVEALNGCKIAAIRLVKGASKDFSMQDEEKNDTGKRVVRLKPRQTHTATLGELQVVIALPDGTEKAYPVRMLVK